MHSISLARLCYINKQSSAQKLVLFIQIALTVSLFLDFFSKMYYNNIIFRYPYFTKERKATSKLSYKFSKISPEITKLAKRSINNYKINPELYTQYDVKRGLRDINGNGVVAGLTNISTIKVLDMGDGMPNHGDGKLYYRGIDVEDIVEGFIKEKRFGYEETVYLLLFGTMPSENELSEFRQLLADYRALPPTFTRDVIMKAPSDNIYLCRT